ncbi:hypothetical protein [Dactylosporangium sp. NPDC048998]|uniref:hypothetical protein n=1 Tax=Dactylosporangium sp. NPDC048998 TaxID=3363976 RepID=UPI0037219794
MVILFSSSSPVNHETGANSAALLITVAFVVVLVIGRVGRSLNGYRNPAPAPMTHHQREVRRDSLHNLVRGWLLLAVLVPVMFVTLYEMIHAGSG